MKTNIFRTTFFFWLFALAGLAPVQKAMAQTKPKSNKVNIDYLTDRIIELSWEEVKGIQLASPRLRYHVFYKSTKETQWKDVLCDENKWRWTSLDPSTTYDFYVRVYGLNSAFDYRYETVQCTTYDLDKTPPVISNKDVMCDFDYLTRSVKLRWIQATDNVTAKERLVYNVSVYNAVEKHDLRAYYSGKDECTFEGLIPDRDYLVLIYVNDDNGNSSSYIRQGKDWIDYPTFSTGKTDTKAPSIPSDKTLTVVPDAGSMTVTWNAASDDATPQYKLRYRLFFSPKEWKTKSEVVSGFITGTPG